MHAKINFFNPKHQHKYINDVTTCIRNYVNGYIDEKTYRQGLHEILNTYREDKSKSGY